MWSEKDLVDSMILECITYTNHLPTESKREVALVKTKLEEAQLWLSKITLS